MNILLINHYAGSSTHGMEYRPYYLAREWVRLGHEVTIAAASFSHLRTAAPVVQGRVTEQVIDGIRYLWYRTPAYGGNKVGRVLNILSFVGNLLWDRRRLARSCRPDVVIASSTYPLDNLPAHRIAQAASAKLVYEVHDLWPLTPVELGQMSPRNPFIVLMQWAENFAYRKADRVVSTLPKAQEHMCQHGMAAEKFACVPNGVDVTEWQAATATLPEDHDRVLTNLKGEGRFVVGYAGGHGISNALDAFIEAAGLLHAQPLAFVLVGQGPEKERLRKKAEEQKGANVVFLPPVPKSSVPALLERMDSLYLGWKKHPLYRFGISPNKLLDYMMAAKPVVHAVAAGNDSVAESGCGVSCEPENPRAIADAVLQLAGCSSEERETMGRRGKNYVMLRHDYAVLARQFIEVIQ